MQIGNLYNSYDNHIQDKNILEGTNTVGQSKVENTSPDVSNLKEGSVFKGEILDIIDDKVTIKLENELKLFARVQGDVEFGIGDQLLFSVKENSANQIFIKPMFDSLYSAQTQVLEKALEMASLSPTEKNFQVAKNLMEAGQPLNRENMTRLLSQSMKFPETSINTLVSLNKMNIPVTAESIAQYERYESFNHQLSADIEQAVDSMIHFKESFPDNVSGKTLLSFAEDMLSTFIKDMPETDGMKGAPIPADITDMEKPLQELQDSAQTSDKAATQQLATAESHMEQGVVSSNMDVLKELAGKEPVDIHQIKDGSFSEGDNIFEINARMVKDFSSLSGLTSSESADFLNAIQNTGVSRETIANIMNTSNTPEQALQQLLQAVSENSADDNFLMQLLDSHAFQKLFGDVIHKSWSINPKQMKDPKEIDALYQRIQKQSRAFEEALSSKGGDGKGFQQNFQNMRQNLSFMEQINHQMIYAQMPLKLSNQNANSELFVYADKRKLMEKKDGISVMLHLDMDHLGQTDIKVTLTGSNVHARFYLNDEESVELFSNNISDLAKQLGLRGFSLTDEVVKRKAETSINKVVDEIIDENAERSIKRYTFDART